MLKDQDRTNVARVPSDQQPAAALDAAGAGAPITLFLAEVAALKDEPRVLDLRNAARYLAISYWSMRDLVLNGHVPAVRLPCPRTRNGRIMRRLLVDRRDLDALIERSRERHD